MLHLVVGLSKSGAAWPEVAKSFELKFDDATVAVMRQLMTLYPGTPSPALKVIATACGDALKRDRDAGLGEALHLILRHVSSAETATR